MDMSLTEYELGILSDRTYDDIKNNIKINNIDGQRITFDIIETIDNKDTGLQGYVLQKEGTDKIVISFRGTELNETSDIKEDVHGIILGNSDYTKNSYGNTTYVGSPGQDALIASGSAKLNDDGTFSYVNKNQFTEADKVVSTYVKEYGADQITFTGHSLGGGLAQYFAVKYDSNAVTFAAADVFNLLTKVEQKQVKNGEFKDQIISYIDPKDLVSTHYQVPVGSMYYINNPSDAGGIGLKTHGISNYLEPELYNDKGYFNPESLYDESLKGQLSLAVNKSPLEFKNAGISGFSVLIQSELMRFYARGMQISEEVLKIRKNSIEQLLDMHFNDMNELKKMYMNSTGAGNYDRLTPADVEDVLHELVTMDKGTPMLLDLYDMEDLLVTLQRLQEDTGEIAFNMEKMANDFENTDKILANWLGLKR